MPVSRDIESLISLRRTGALQPGFHMLKTRIGHNFFPISEDIKLGMRVQFK